MAIQKTEEPGFSAGEGGGAPGKPVLIYDGDCDFCKFWIRRWRGKTGDRVDYQPFQKVADEYPQIPAADFERAVQFVNPGGAVSSGADAVFDALSYADRPHRFLALCQNSGPLRSVARIIYSLVAGNRALFSLLTFLLIGRDPEPPSYLIARAVFVRVLAVIYGIAFVSLGVQIRGLAGAQGILPAADFLHAVRAQTGLDRFWLVPTICWVNASDTFLLSLCWAGTAIAAAVLCGVMPMIGFVLLWLIYLSLCSVCQDFLGFQWDILLLETGFLAILLAAPKFRLDWRREDSFSRIGRWLLLFLLFRLMFESGIVKLSFHDPTWRNLTALAYHYHTQPLPLRTSWYADQAALWFQKLSALFMYGAELLAPFAIFGPRNLRRAGCAIMAALQIMIGITGNYAFFNLLVIALCLLLLDDASFPEVWRKRFQPPPGVPAGRFSSAWWFAAPFAAAYLLITATQLFLSCKPETQIPAPLLALQSGVEPFRSINPYGLFRVMTTSRPEIIIEGSDDDLHWREYRFKWKPGDPMEPPRLAEPHQPRLDWQMWFAALGKIQQNRWFINFLYRLLQGSPEVLNLLAANPFPGSPPHYLRASLYEYRFTRVSDHTAAWWRREYIGLYCPAVSLSDFRK